MSFEPESPASKEELQLKAVLEVTLSQTAVFMKQVEILQQQKIKAQILGREPQKPSEMLDVLSNR